MRLLGDRPEFTRVSFKIRNRAPAAKPKLISKAALRRTL